MNDQLAAHGVRIVALSKDTVEQVRYHYDRDRLDALLLSDADLTVIRQYGVEHHKAMEFSIGRFQLFGVPLALVPTVKTMAIPTTLLLDEHGVVQWIDQADDYRLRSDVDRVLQAVCDVFGPPAR